RKTPRIWLYSFFRSAWSDTTRVWSSNSSTCGFENPDQFSEVPGVVWKNWNVLPSGSGRPLQAYVEAWKVLPLPSARSRAPSSTFTFTVMPISASCALTTSNSWIDRGVLSVLKLKLKPLGMPPSASLAFALSRSRLIGLIVSSYAQLDGEIGPLE